LYLSLSAERQNSKTQLKVGIFFALISATCCIRYCCKCCTNGELSRRFRFPGSGPERGDVRVAVPDLSRSPRGVFLWGHQHIQGSSYFQLRPVVPSTLSYHERPYLTLAIALHHTIYHTNSEDECSTQQPSITRWHVVR
jgi:hypothetical protein